MGTAIEHTGLVGAPIKLNGTKPLFKGHQRLVFQHPGDEQLLVKVMRGEYADQKYGPAGRFHNRHRRCRHYHPFLLEFEEYLVVCARSPEFLPYLQEILGFVHTDLGLGLVVRKVLGPEGDPAHSVTKLVRRQTFTPDRQRLLEAFIDALLASRIVIDDLHSSNMVLGLDDQGHERFVLIDGVGSSTLVPFKVFFPWINRWSKRQRIARLRQQIAAGIAKAEALARSQQPGS